MKTRLQIILSIVALFLFCSATVITDAGQSNWYWCSKCQGLFFAGNGSSGACPAGGGHSWKSSGNYTLYNYPACGGQKGWYWCSKCEGMFFGEHSTNGKCAGGGSHFAPYAKSGSYEIVQNMKTSCGAQNGWRWCNKCEGLFFSKNADWGVCPGGGQHSATGSGDYYLKQ